MPGSAAATSAATIPAIERTRERGGTGRERIAFSLIRVLRVTEPVECGAQARDLVLSRAIGRLQLGRIDRAGRAALRLPPPRRAR